MPLLIVLTIYVFVLLGWQLKRGVFTEATFADAPPRRGALGIFDIVMTLGLWILGQGIAVQLTGIVEGQDLTRDMLKEPSHALVAQVCTYAAWLPLVVFVIVRGAMATEGGSRAFGFALRNARRTILLTLGTIVFIIPAAFLTNDVIAIAAQLFGYDAPAIAHESLRTIQIATPTEQAAFGVIVVLLAPFVEELMFRGMFQTAARQGGIMPGPWATILFISAFFAVSHVGSVPPFALAGLFVLAIGMGYAYEKSGSLLVPMVIHAVFNAVNFGAVVLDLVRPETAGLVGS